MQDNNSFLDLIRSNITNYGYHITTVNSDTEPSYSYSIGLSNTLGYELVFAGGYSYLHNDILLIFNDIVNSLINSKNNPKDRFKVNGLGEFSLNLIHESWVINMLLGAIHFFKNKEIKAYQIIPDKDKFSLEIPNMSIEFTPKKFPIWKWLVNNWDLNVPKNSTVTTNLKALYGEKITEVMRWEIDNWEMFAGNGTEVEESDIRIVPIGVIIGIDDSILPALNLDIEKGLWRDISDLEWNAWG